MCLRFSGHSCHTKSLQLSEDFLIQLELSSVGESWFVHPRWCFCPSCTVLSRRNMSNWRSKFRLWMRRPLQDQGTLLCSVNSFKMFMIWVRTSCPQIAFKPCSLTVWDVTTKWSRGGQASLIQISWVPSTCTSLKSWITVNMNSCGRELLTTSFSGCNQSSRTMKISLLPSSLHCKISP
jgi:hypothetical protein